MSLKLMLISYRHFWIHGPNIKRARVSLNNTHYLRFAVLFLCRDCGDIKGWARQLSARHDLVVMWTVCGGLYQRLLAWWSGPSSGLQVYPNQAQTYASGNVSGTLKHLSDQPSLLILHICLNTYKITSQFWKNIFGWMHFKRFS